MVRFIHTADWQLGMTRHFLEGEAQARFTQDRFDALKQIGALAQEHDAQFVVVSGDVFEHNRLDRKTVVRALDAMRSIHVPVYLLPGNHDTLDAGSIYTSKEFQDNAPDLVHVLTGEPITHSDGVEIHGNPWTTKRPLADPVSPALEGLEADGTTRIVIGHGTIDQLDPDRDNPASIRRESLLELLGDGVVHYVALGDRHQVTEIAPRIWYSGAHVATDYRDFQQTHPNNVLLVDLGDDCTVTELKVGAWHFIRKEFAVNTMDDVETVASFIDSIEDKPRAILKAAYTGTLDMQSLSRLEGVKDHARDVLGGYEEWTRKTDLVTKPSEEDLDSMELTGFAQATFVRLQGASSEDETAARAMELMYRLAREVDS